MSETEQVKSEVKLKNPKRVEAGEKRCRSKKVEKDAAACHGSNKT